MLGEDEEAETLCKPEEKAASQEGFSYSSNN